MHWNEAHRVAMIAAAEAQEDLALNTFQRIEVFDAMSAANLKVIFRKLEGCAALYLPASLGGRPGAILNASHPLALQRYSGAHEFGHHVFDHGGRVDRDTEPRRARGELSVEEKLAEAFAAWFLMPPEAVEPALDRLGRKQPQSPLDAYALALRLGTSFRAMCVHLASLKLLGSAAATSWSETPLKSIKQQLTANSPPGGWRSDVWLLSGADADSQLVPRCGDRLLLDLAGWDVETLPPGTRGELLAANDLLTPPRWQIDLSPDMDSGPATLVLRQDGRSLDLRLMVERPRVGLFVPTQGVAV